MSRLPVPRRDTKIALTEPDVNDAVVSVKEDIDPRRFPIVGDNAIWPNYPAWSTNQIFNEHR